MGFLADLTGATAARLAAEARRDAQARERQSHALLADAYAEARPHLIEQRDQWDALLSAGERYGGAGEMLLSALGVTHPALARSAFRASPGYDFEVSQGLDAAARMANRTGGAAGGNILAELQRLGQGYAGREWASWLAGLQGLSQLGAQTLGQATAGRAGALGALAGYARDEGRDAVGVTREAGEAVQRSFAQEGSARTQGAGNLAGLGLGLARLAVGNNGLGAVLGGLGKGYAGYGSGTGGLY